MLCVLTNELAPCLLKTDDNFISFRIMPHYLFRDPYREKACVCRNPHDIPDPVNSGVSELVLYPRPTLGVCAGFGY